MEKDEKQINSLKPEILNTPLSEISEEQVKAGEAFIKKQIEEDQETSKTRHYDKYNLFRNIRALLDKKDDVKLGQIEKEAGCQTGYMSRLEKPDNTSEPNTEFIVTAAKLLGVTVDFLLYGTVAEMTATEEYLLKFIKNLVEDTKDDTLDWKKETLAMLRNIEPYRYGRTSHPLYESDNAEQVYYGSMFYKGENVSVSGPIYNAYLPSSSTQMYIVPCTLNKKEFYEVYFVEDMQEGYMVNTVCCTEQICETLKHEIEILYSEIEKAAANVHIDSTTRSIIDQYMSIGISDDDVPF